MKEYKLSELLRIRNGRDYKHLSEGPYPVYGSGGLMLYVNEYLYNKPSILLPRKGSLSNIQYSDTPFWTVDTLYYTEVNESLVNPYYLYNYLKLLDLSRLDSGTGVPSMTFDSYYNIKVMLPELSDQNRVSNLLRTIEKGIVNKQQTNDALWSLIRYLYDYWFVQFDFPCEDGKPYKSSGREMILNDEIKLDLPVGWRIAPLSECICSINTGLNPRKYFKLNTGGSIRYLTVKNLTNDGLINFTSCDCIDENARRIVHARSDIKKGDILFASISPLGRCYMILDDPRDWDINESVFSIRPNNRVITSSFLYLTLMSESFVKKAEGYSAGSVFKGIRMAEILSLKTVLPPKKILDEFEKQVFQPLLLRAKLFDEGQQLSSLRDFLLPMLIKGQLSIS